MMEGEGLGLGMILAIWRFFVVGWFAWLVGVESGSKVVFVGLTLPLPLPLPLPCFVAGVVGRVFGSRGKKGGEC